VKSPNVVTVECIAAVDKQHLFKMSATGSHSSHRLGMTLFDDALFNAVDKQHLFKMSATGSHSSTQLGIPLFDDALFNAVKNVQKHTVRALSESAVDYGRFNLLGGIALVQAIPHIATHFSVAWSVCLSSVTFVPRWTDLDAV